MVESVEVVAEAAFVLPCWMRLEAVPQVDSARSWDFLSREVHRRPRYLALHLARVQAALDLDGEAVYAALVDLILVLDGRGRPLQRRMILGAERWLPSGRRERLRRYLAGGLAAEALPFSPRSVLQPGLIGASGEGEADASGAEAEVDLLEAARTCLGLGQIDQARELFERILLADPGCEAAREELLAIFQAIDDHDDDFLRLYDHLQRHRCLDPAWERYRAGVA